jgi:hypothetical protein
MAARRFRSAGAHVQALQELRQRSSDDGGDASLPARRMDVGGHPARRVPLTGTRAAGGGTRLGGPAIPRGRRATADRLRRVRGRPMVSHRGRAC